MGIGTEGPPMKRQRQDSDTLLREFSIKPGYNNIHAFKKLEGNLFASKMNKD
jgi:hypothetical protein